MTALREDKQPCEKWWSPSLEICDCDLLWTFIASFIHQINIEQTCKIQHSFRAGLTANSLKLVHEWVQLSFEYVFFFFCYVVIFYLYILIFCWCKEEKVNIMALLFQIYAFKLIPWVSLAALLCLKGRALSWENTTWWSC